MKLCFLYQKTLSFATDSERPAPRWVERHVAGCPACREFQQSELKLVHALRTDAAAEVSSFPPFLHARIMSQVGRNRPELSSWAVGIRWLRGLAVPALALILAVGYWLRKPESLHPPSAPSLVSEVASEQSETPSITSPAQLLAWGEKFDQPLEGELHSVLNDARAALASLSDNFLPQALVARTNL
jgi:hypothetical protein